MLPNDSLLILTVGCHPCEKKWAKLTQTLWKILVWRVKINVKAHSKFGPLRTTKIGAHIFEKIDEISEVLLLDKFQSLRFVFGREYVFSHRFLGLVHKSSGTILFLVVRCLIFLLHNNKIFSEFFHSCQLKFCDQSFLKL